MDIAKRDLAIQRIKSEINNRRSFLENTFDSLKSSKNQNILLTDIFNDYNSYYDNKLAEKKALHIALNNLYDYLESIRESAEITKDDAKKAKKSAKEILKEVKNIEEEIEKFNKILNYKL
jgi:translation initiation factor 2B subunit (eIF-2B alpha/beta/delta family)